MSKQRNLLKKIAAYDLQRNKVDYEMAASLHELRAMLKTDANFITVINNFFHIHGKTLNMWLRAAKFYPNYTKKQWLTYGGRESIQKLAYLTSPQRIKVLRKIEERLTKQPTVSTETVGYIISSMGFRTRTPGQGRNRRTEVERRLLLCQNWLDVLYKDYDLPKMPADVRAAAKRTKLAQAMKQLASA